MPSSNQILNLLRARGSLSLSEICNYFWLTGQPWLAPVTATLAALIVAGTVYQDPLSSGFVLTVHP